jgi:hypothetical protein
MGLTILKGDYHIDGTLTADKLAIPLGNFLQLEDVPDTYTLQDGRILVVNEGSCILEFKDLGTLVTFLLSDDTPSSYAGAALQHLRVNAGETAVEFSDPTFLESVDSPSSYVGESFNHVRVDAGETGLEFSSIEYERTFLSTSGPIPAPAGAHRVVIVDASSGDIVLTLPDALTIDKYRIDVVRVNPKPNAVKVATILSQTIIGETDITLSQQWTSITFFSGGSDWVIL